MVNLFDNILSEKGVEKALPVIAGPCSAETREQVLSTASGLSECGVKIFRAGIWKPRTKPGCFEGVGEKGLPWLMEVKEKFGMLTATEVANRVHVEQALSAGVDILWIGARTTANPFSVQEIAETIAESGKNPIVLVKNPVNPDIELWAGAIERLKKQGVERLVAVHRGFSSYGNSAFRNPPFWPLPFEMKRRYPEIPMLSDPSHMGGERSLVGQLAKQSVLMGFDGLMIESHCHPERALSDAAQQITPFELADILKDLEGISRGEDPTDLEALRREIDDCDSRLMDILAERMAISRKIGEAKKQAGMAVLQTMRHDEVMNTRVSKGKELGMNEKFLNTLFSAIHAESVRQQIELLKK